MSSVSLVFHINISHCRLSEVQAVNGMIINIKSTVEIAPPDLKRKNPFYSSQWFYSGYSGFYTLYLCQGEVFPLGMVTTQ